MDEKIKSLLEALTDEQKARLAACQTPEELAALLGEMGVELPDELLDEAAGGFLHLGTGQTATENKLQAPPLPNPVILRTDC